MLERMVKEFWEWISRSIKSSSKFRFREEELRVYKISARVVYDELITDVQLIYSIP